MTVSLLAESFNVAIIDSGFTKTVCGEVWLQYYTDSLNVSDKIKLIFANLVIPLNLVKLTADAIDYEIPLLLSEDSMKKVNAMTDFKNDKMIMFQYTRYIIQNRSGHYSILLNNLTKKY